MALCPYCGADNREEAAFCTSCRRTIEPSEWLRPRPAPSPPAGAQPWDARYYDRTPYQQQPLYTLVGFWPRAGAWLLDTLFVALLAIVPALLLGAGLAYAVSASQAEPQSVFEEDDQEGDVVLAALAGGLIGFYAVYLSYYTIANGRGGGWGKRIVGLRILRQRDGELPGYGTGFLRTVAPAMFGFVPLVGSLLQLLNYLWCIWDSQKQCWHDKVAGTLVVVAR
jgi:uncharacterized RDD family membrane protein YckC